VSSSDEDDGLTARVPLFKILEGRARFCIELADEEVLLCLVVFAWRFLSAALLHFLSSESISGYPLKNEGCAYISVSGPRRTLVKPYCTSENKGKVHEWLSYYLILE